MNIKKQKLQWLQVFNSINKTLVAICFIGLILTLTFQDFIPPTQATSAAYAFVVLAATVFMIKKIFFHIPRETKELGLLNIKGFSVLFLGVIGGIIIGVNNVRLDTSLNPSELVISIFFVPLLVLLVVTVFDLLTFDLRKLHKDTKPPFWLPKRFQKNKDEDFVSVLSYLRIFIHLIDTVVITTIVYSLPSILKYITTTNSLSAVIGYSMGAILALSYLRDYTLAFGIRNFNMQKILFSKKK